MSASDKKRPDHDAGRGAKPDRSRQDRHADEELDEALEESFPASDPPSPARPADHPGRGPKKDR